MNNKIETNKKINMKNKFNNNNKKILNEVIGLKNKKSYSSRMTGSIFSSNKTTNNNIIKKITEIRNKYNNDVFISKIKALYDELTSIKNKSVFYYSSENKLKVNTLQSYLDILLKYFPDDYYKAIPFGRGSLNYASRLSRRGVKGVAGTVGGTAKIIGTTVKEIGKSPYYATKALIDVNDNYIIKKL